MSYSHYLRNVNRLRERDNHRAFSNGLSALLLCVGCLSMPNEYHSSLITYCCELITLRSVIELIGLLRSEDGHDTKSPVMRESESMSAYSSCCELSVCHPLTKLAIFLLLPFHFFICGSFLIISPCNLLSIQGLI